MKKYIIPALAILLIVAICLGTTGCSIVRSLLKDYIPPEDGVQYVDGEMIYDGMKYHSSDGIFDRTLTDADFELGWGYGLKGKIFYYAETETNPLYIVSGNKYYAYDVYFREDFDWQNETFFLEDTTIEIRLPEAFSETEPVKAIPGMESYRLVLKLEEAHKLKLVLSCFWNNGQWYCSRGGKYYALSEDFVATLLENGYLRADTLPKPSVEGLEGVNQLRPDYDWGDCRNLKGNVSVVLLCMDDFESSWTTEEMVAARNNEIQEAFDFLEREAATYGVTVDFSISVRGPLYYDAQVVNNDEEVTWDVMEQAAYRLGYTDADQMRAEMQKKLGTEEIIFVAAFNKYGDAFGLNPQRGSEYDYNEHCVVFYEDLTHQFYVPGTYVGRTVSCTLYLYGAENLWSSMWRSELARQLCADDIMYEGSYDIIRDKKVVGPATAFYIGWTDEPPQVMYDEKW